jgi:hypothetical protein
MRLDEARELREELEAIEATMHRIKELWNDKSFPCGGGDIVELGKDFGKVLEVMEAIIEKAGEMPTGAVITPEPDRPLTMGERQQRRQEEALRKAGLLR